MQLRRSPERLLATVLYAASIATAAQARTNIGSIIGAMQKAADTNHFLTSPSPPQPPNHLNDGRTPHSTLYSNDLTFTALQDRLDPNFRKKNRVTEVRFTCPLLFRRLACLPGPRPPFTPPLPSTCLLLSAWMPSSHLRTPPLALTPPTFLSPPSIPKSWSRLPSALVPSSNALIVALRPHSWPESGVFDPGDSPAMLPTFALPSFASRPFLSLLSDTVLTLYTFLCFFSMFLITARQHPQRSADHAKPQARWHRRATLLLRVSRPLLLGSRAHGGRRAFPPDRQAHLLQ